MPLPTTNQLVDTFKKSGPLTAAQITGADPSATNPEKNRFISNASQNFETPSGATVSGGGELVSGPPQASSADRAFESYLQSLRPSEELAGATKRLGAMDTQAALDYEKALQSGETLGFARGEAGLTARQNAILRAGQAGTVSALTGLEERRGDIAKARFDYEQGKIQERKPFELSPGQERYEYNPETGEYEQIASVAPKPTTPKGITRSGGLTYTPTDAAEDSQALEASRGPDGYVDPSIYLQLYNEWIASGGLLKDFKTTYKPENYVNPANTWLPKHLMPKSEVSSELQALLNILK